jgi:hypothetical protein
VLLVRSNGGACGMCCVEEKRNAYRVLVGKVERKKPFARSRSRLEDNINTLRTGDANLRFLHYKCERRMTQICLLTRAWF